MYIHFQFLCRIIVQLSHRIAYSGNVIVLDVCYQTKIRKKIIIIVR